MRRVVRVAICVLIAVVAVSCFKDEKYATLMRIAVYSQNVSDDPVLKATNIESYGYWIDKSEEWEVLSWEDALDRRITNKLRPAETRTEPDVVGTFDPMEEYQVAINLTEPVALLVVVDPDNKIYAYREYEVGINLPEVLTHLHMYAWRKTGTANGWNVVNPFPDEEREPLVPVEDEPTDDTLTE